MAKPKNIKLSYIEDPSLIINSLSSSSFKSLILSPKTSSKHNLFNLLYKKARLWFLALFLVGLFCMLKTEFNPDPFIPFSPNPCSDSSSINSDLKGRKDEILNVESQSSMIRRNGFLKSEVGFVSNGDKNENESVNMGNGYGDVNGEESEFWKQPDGLGYRPCLEFSDEYKKKSDEIKKEKTKYLLVVVSGGLNQQRNQIVDAVVIARILGATLVVPILQVNVIWGDESEFSDIFDLDHFKKVLADDVRIVSSLPSTHIRTRPIEEKRTPLHVSPQWIQSRYLKRIKRVGVLLLRGLDSRLSTNLPHDLQKLRCKVAFNALRFSTPISTLGNKLAERMRSKGGPYLALHLRMEKDVWVRTGCLPGLSHKYDDIVNNERKRRPELLTARSNMSYHERKLSGLCPLNAVEVTRLLKALGAPKSARIYWAGGEPLGGKEALLPLTSEFPYFYNKQDLALRDELEPFANRASLMAAIDYIVSEQSDIFMPSHGGNMGHAIQGHRAYAGHKKYITPNKRHMLPYFLNSTLSDTEFKRIITELHQESLGQPDLRSNKSGKDVTKFPVPECMCK